MEFTLSTHWQAAPAPQDSADFNPKAYSRDHLINFGSGQEIQCSAAPAYQGSDDKVNPEESLLAALSSCHMLTFLAIAHMKRLPVQSYVDQAGAELGKNAAGKLAITKIVLNPTVTFVEGIEVSADVLEKMHHKAHENCFVANSITAEVIVK